ncbi:PTS transporter subunit EIIC [Mycoplasmoides fastidiosum]|nr:PTS transporter subunit EIIC [Mycoplasmoides fastidiosum]
MFPIAVLPIAALLLRIGVLITDPLSNGSVGISSAQVFIGKLISTPGQVIFDNLAIIFAIGVAFGLAKDNRGEAALVGAIVWFGMTALLKEDFLASAIWSNVATAENLENKSMLLYFLRNNKPVYQLDTGVLGGIVVGVLVSLIYNRYKSVRLPLSLSFFGGRRFVPMLGVLTVIPLGLFFAIVWPGLQFALINIGQSLAASEGGVQAVSGGVYAFLNRLLQPFVLHHIINVFVWFQLPITGHSITTQTELTVNGDITAFQNGIVGSGLFTTGFFPLFLGGLPGAAAAMIMTADKKKRRQMALFYGGATLVAFLTGIDEPLVFSFIFVSPLLYVINALLTGIFYALVTLTQMSIGIGFSAGFIDYVVSFGLSWQLAREFSILANPLWVWAFALVMFGVYYFVFFFVIKKFKIAIPGREEQLGLTEVVSSQRNIFDEAEQKHQTQGVVTDKYQTMAKDILNILGQTNIELVENCATRLRLTLKTNAKDQVNDQLIMQTGAKGVIRVGDKGYQIIIGTDVEHVADQLNKLIKSQ